jgi:hypothetical protein
VTGEKGHNLQAENEHAAGARKETNQMAYSRHSLECHLRRQWPHGRIFLDQCCCSLNICVRHPLPWHGPPQKALAVRLSPSIPCSLPPLTSLILPMLSDRQRGICKRKVRRGPPPGAQSSPSWSSWATEEELVTDVPDLQRWSLKNWQVKYDERVA